MAYEAVAYLTLEGENGTRSTTLVSKQRVAPGKEITLARLELMACLLAGRLCGYILEALKQQPSNIYLRTDSTTALYWIHEDVGRWKQFARNRVTKIQRLADKCVCRHYPGRENPAREIPAMQLAKNAL
ncbi:hypothetical protein HPB48_017555 [Haemaphysalis longicornis]|uniref:Uncharacterized protein n=1 Tax=Haemaphysalis longicornis TaxID=44386 RepID=A0A9J6FJF0_HAELO|nr:hypothetical protein HPB48_017555 [Haemaphysalis longicornis]